MIAVTSIAPNHINEGIQLKAVQSWIDCGLDVYSFNHPSEILALSSVYKNVNFISTLRTQNEIFGKHYVCVNAIFDYAKENKQDICLINSDIELKIDKETISRIEKKMQTSLVMANRVDYESSYNGGQYMAGIDAFFINKTFFRGVSSNIVLFRTMSL